MKIIITYKSGSGKRTAEVHSFEEMQEFVSENVIHEFSVVIKPVFQV